MWFIVGSRMTKAPDDLASHFHWNGDVFTDGQIIDTVTPRHANSQRQRHRAAGRTGLGPRRASGAWRAVWAYSAKRARRDQKTLAAQEARATGGHRRRAGRASPPGSSRPAADDRILDEASLARAAIAGRTEGLRHQHPRRR